MANARLTLKKKKNVMGEKYLQNKSVLLQTVTQPHKLAVAPTHGGGLLAETHAVRLKDKRGDAISGEVAGTANRRNPPGDTCM